MLDPETTPLTLPVFGWLEIADKLASAGDGALSEAIRWAMDGRRLGDDATFALTAAERARVDLLLAEPSC